MLKVKKPKQVWKAWGYELWIHNSFEYCGKILHFNNKGSKFSLHYHLKKDEAWYVTKGAFVLLHMDLKKGKRLVQDLKVGDVIHVPRGEPHQLIACQPDSEIFEVSTQHFDEDSYRIESGDKTIFDQMKEEDSGYDNYMPGDLGHA